MAFRDNVFQQIYQEVFIRVCKLVREGQLVEKVDRIPIDMYPKKVKAEYRCCIYKQREIIRYRIMACLGFLIENEEDEAKPMSEYAREALSRTRVVQQQAITLCSDACQSCVPSKYFVTNACQGCLARPCMVNCPKQCITRVGNQAQIDPEKCIKCGRCEKVCPYHAIIRLHAPCEEACPVGAIQKDHTGKAVIDFDKCIYCGNCFRACPFGAINQPSQIVDVMRRLVEGQDRMVAMLAPAILGQFRASLDQLNTALLQLGFAEVVEVSAGADKTAVLEAAEFQERIQRGDPLMTTSCCPAFYEAVKKHCPGLRPYISHTASPMSYIADMVKQRAPNAQTVFVGPCVAKRMEGMRRENVDYVLTVRELSAMLDSSSIDPAKCEATPLNHRATSRQGLGFCITAGVADAVSAALPFAAQRQFPSGERPQNASATTTTATTADCPAESETRSGSPEPGQEPPLVRPHLIQPLDKAGFKGLLQIGRNPAKSPGNLIECMACPGGCVGGPATLIPSTMASSRVRKMLLARPHLCDIEDVHSL
eukprot:gnl/Trimastix_PCT/1345.p1 GENE.gnl/Trimastix_PCT/1345~~gnl/Trimastix_PCT/1345.p1  ORF type:complete len:538 (+),score=131.57 gnl/Trimastix_PCT/1345:67-1680(+)